LSRKRKRYAEAARRAFTTFSNLSYVRNRAWGRILSGKRPETNRRRRVLWAYYARARHKQVLTIYPGEFRSGGSHFLPALFYLILSIGGGLAAIILGDRLGQLCISKIRGPTPSPKTTRRLTEMLTGALQETASHYHLDILDDLLIPELQDGRETRQKHQGR
jgi:hypothetical protein